MQKLAFLDCPTGLSGDMCLGALVDAGVPLDYLKAQVERLVLPEAYGLRAEGVRRQGQAATKVYVDLPPLEEVVGHSHPPARHLREIEELIQRAQLPQRVTAWSLGIFRRLAIAEGAVHGIAPEKVHFHEVGATDAIVDIVGTCLGLDWLGIDRLYCAPLPTGSGTVHAAHGLLPVPAPAVLKLMEMAQVPIYSADLRGELVTPTGAAIATELAQQFGAPPPMRLQRVGLGAGTKELPVPNILRLWIGVGTAEEASPRVASRPAPAPLSQGLPEAPLAGIEAVTVLETQVDDLSPQAIGYLYERLFQGGALDVFCQGITMKKSRPGHLITVVTYPDRVAACEVVLFQETTTLGIRRTEQQRHRLQREIQAIATPWGIVQVKVATNPTTGALVNAHPEYEDCAAIARQHQIPWRTVHTEVLCRWQAQQKLAAVEPPSYFAGSSSLKDSSSSSEAESGASS